MRPMDFNGGRARWQRNPDKAQRARSGLDALCWGQCQPLHWHVCRRVFKPTRRLPSACTDARDGKISQADCDNRGASRSLLAEMVNRNLLKRGSLVHEGHGFKASSVSCWHAQLLPDLLLVYSWYLVSGCQRPRAHRARARARNCAFN